jgi:pimeloyl-ACP methyl ester carboxylesterase
VFGFIVFFLAGLAVFNSKACAGAANAQVPSIAGTWQGSIEAAGGRIGIRIVFVEASGGLTATIDIPQQGATGLALREIRRDGERIHFELPAGPTTAVFDGAIGGRTIAGAFRQGAAEGTFTLSPAEPAPSPPGPTGASRDASADIPYREIAVTFTSGSASLSGTLTLPSGEGPFPAVAMLTGSGPQNRDEELFGFKPFRILADHLTRLGIGVLRWDDRGVGGSTGGGPDVTTEEFATDANAAVAWLGGRSDVDRRRIGLLGHSEGGIAAVMAAGRSREVAFIVLLAGSAVDGETLLRAQAERLARAAGAGDQAIVRLRAQQDRLFRAVRTGEGWDAVADGARLGAGVTTGAPSSPALESTIRTQIAAAKTGWYRFFLDYDPRPALESVACPVLALYGELDLQVPAELNRTALETALARGGNRDVTTSVFPGANHLFVQARTGLPGEYAALDKRFVPELLETVSAWILARVK